MSEDVVTMEADLISIICWAHEGCGVHFAIPLALREALRTHGGVLFCPKGHRLGFGESDVAKLNKELERKDRIIADERERTAAARRDRDHARRQTNGVRGALAKAKKNAGAV